MKILEQVFSKIKPIHKRQRDFFMLLVQGLIGAAGKRTFRNLSRYMLITEHTFSRQMAKTLDFIDINAELIKSARGEKDVLIAAQDASYISKSGKKTYGLDYFWNGSAGKIDKGLEVDVIAVVKVDEKREAYALSAEQTPANPIPKSERKKKKVTDVSKIDFCLDHLKKTLSQLVALGIKHIAADAYFAKIKYVAGVVAMGLHVISKLRKDARLRRIYTGKQKSRGRKKRYDNGSVNFEDFKQSTVTKIDGENIELRSCIAYSVSLKRTIKVVLVRKSINENKYAEAFLFSTDLELTELQIYEFYVSRFQIEFIFRDAKGFTGLGDCQSRDPRRINYHFNASLIALNVARFQDAELQEIKGVRHAFSMTNWARKYHVDIVINRFIAMFDLDQTLIKLHPDYDSLLSFGNVMH
jgi:hypothetical protein